MRLSRHKETNDKIKKIQELLKKNPNGIWLYEIANVLAISKGSIYYIIFGQDKPVGRGHYGGYLEDDVEDTGVLEGRNRKIKLKR